MKKWLQGKISAVMRKLGAESLIFGGVAALLLVSSVMVVVAAADGWAEPIQGSLAIVTQETLVTTAPAQIAAEETTTTTSYLHEAIPVDSFTVAKLAENVTSDLDYTEWFYSQTDECRYLCLPSTADRNALQITYTAKGGQLYLNDVPVSSGAITDLLSTADSFTVRVGDTEYGTLTVLQSDLGCVFLSTESGGLDQIDANKNREEAGSVLMLNANGDVEYQGEFEKITGRGNSSWDYSKKKSYNLKLPQKSDLYDMGKAKKWALVSNYLDHSMIRNSVAMALSERAGLEYTMAYVYVDLYADGAYRGTYQLFERVQVQSQRVDIEDLEEATEKVNTQALEEYAIVSSTGVLKTYEKNSYRYCEIPTDPADITGGYLLEFQTYNRYESQTDVCGFVTSQGQCVQLKDPEYASEAQVLYIRQFVQELEDAIYSEDGYNSLGKHYSEYIDVDSWVMAYLIQEITANADGSYTSFFLWKESDLYGDGKLHAGPVWDFDLAFANFNRIINGYACCNPNTLYVAHMPISTQVITKDSTLGWLGTLYAKEDFRAQVVACYFETFEPILNDLCDDTSATGIHGMGDALASSAAMNNARWNMLGKNKPLGPVNGYTYEECVEYIDSFVTKKQAFLVKEWLPDVQSDAAAALEDAYDAMPLTRYDEAALTELETLKAEGLAQIESAVTYTEVTAALETTIAAMNAIPTAYRYGDFNNDGEVDTGDCIDMLQHYADGLISGDVPLTAVQLQNGDTDGNGIVDIRDCTDVLLYIAEQIIESSG